MLLEWGVATSLVGVKAFTQNLIIFCSCFVVVLDGFVLSLIRRFNQRVWISLIECRKQELKVFGPGKFLLTGAIEKVRAGQWYIVPASQRLKHHPGCPDAGKGDGAASLAEKFPQVG